MLADNVKERLRDPEYLDRHLIAASSLAYVGESKWYDSFFLRRFEAAKHYLSHVMPNALEGFVAGFEPLRPPFGFDVKSVPELFDAATRERIREIAKAIPDAEKKDHEAAEFGRDVVHDNPYFHELQRELLPKVNELAGRELEPSYNFLSLYGETGKCDVHLDEPMAMFTLDYCIEQSDAWPIYFSQLRDWPTRDELAGWTEEGVLGDPSLEWTPHTLEPNGALLFNGSSQWHHRKQNKPGSFCNLLFFHYYPAGCHDLVVPAHWPRYFDLPILEPLCDLFVDGPTKMAPA